jgi:glutamate 5-kinase
MTSKIEVARKAAALGVDVWIARGADPATVVDLAQGGGRGTQFLPSARPTSVKRWVASARGHEKGLAVVNAGAESALLDRARLTSVLPVGVIRAEGDFSKGEVIRLESESGKLLGYGRAQYGASTARRYLGQRGKRALVHYNYLYLESDPK